MTECYVLLTQQHTYFVEYLIGQLILSKNISEAMVFDDYETAKKFKEMLLDSCSLSCSVNTFIK